MEVKPFEYFLIFVLVLIVIIVLVSLIGPNFGCIANGLLGEEIFKCLT